ncbi:hypothetical protein ACETK3_21200, partial [Arthrobacter sp. E44]|uniref:hypothetical protein n=1 Tax=Arthrobacter sp. E44 TaxID=3341794 RepID=UPI0035A5A675
RPGIHQRTQLQNAYPVAQCRQNSGMNILHGRTFTTNREEPLWRETTEDRRVIINLFEPFNVRGMRHRQVRVTQH